MKLEETEVREKQMKMTSADHNTAVLTHSQKLCLSAQWRGSQDLTPIPHNKSVEYGGAHKISPLTEELLAIDVF